MHHNLSIFGGMQRYFSCAGSGQRQTGQLSTFIFILQALCTQMTCHDTSPRGEHSGAVLVGTTWPYRQVALLPPLLTWCAEHVKVISSPCLMGKAGSVMTLLHVELIILHSDSEILNDQVICWHGQLSAVSLLSVFIWNVKPQCLHLVIEMMRS